MTQAALYPPLSGTFLPMSCIFARDAAESSARQSGGLAQPMFADEAASVVVARPRWAKTKRLIRYPSPDRRICANRRRPPLFSGISIPSSFRRSFAHCAPSRHCDLDGWAVLALNGTETSFQSMKGKDPCAHISSRVWRSVAPWALRPAVTPLRNRRCSAQEPVRARRLSLVAALRPVRLSGLQVTWPTAKPTQTVVDKFASRRTPTRQPSHRTIGAVCAGGLFCVMPMRSSAGPRTERRDQPCSRRS